MALERFLDSFNTGTGAAGTTIARSGYGFQPKAFLIWTAGRTDTGDAVGRANMNTSVGFGADASNVRAICSSSQDTPTTSNADKYHTETACLITLNTSGAVNGALTVDSIDSDGITFRVTVQFAASVRVFVLALGGSDITDVGIVTHVQPTSGTVPFTEDVTGFGFQPDTVVTLSAYISTAPPGVLAGGGGGIAFTAGATPASVNWGSRSLNGIGTSNTYLVCRSGETIAAPDFQTSGAVLPRATITSWLSTGVQFTWNEIDANARRFFHLGIKGGQYKVGSVLSLTNTTNDINSGSLGFAPQGAVLISGGKAETGSDTTQDDNALSLGAFTSTSSRAAIAHFDDDNAGTMVVGSAQELDSVYIHMPNTAGSVDGLADIQAVNADSFDLRMTDADPAQSFIGFWAFGSGAVEGSASGSISIGGSATGTHGVTGSGSGSIPIAGSATGLLVPVGSASGSIPITGSATGTHGVTGSASGTIPIAGSATGVHGVTGTAGGGGGTAQLDVDAAYGATIVNTFPGFIRDTGQNLVIGTDGGNGLRGALAFDLDNLPNATVTLIEFELGIWQQMGLTTEVHDVNGYGNNGADDPETDTDSDYWDRSASGPTYANDITDYRTSTGLKTVDITSGAAAHVQARAGQRFALAFRMTDDTTNLTTRLFRADNFNKTAPDIQVPSLHIEYETGGGAISVGGSASGTHGVAGSASGSIAITGSASGTHGVTGSASGVVAITGSATGEVEAGAIEGTASGSISVTGSATGSHGVTGSASGSIAPAGSATGTHGVQGTASGSVPIAGSASGVHGVQGSASGAISIAGSATGVHGVTGAASGSVAIAGSASGTHGVTGSTSGQISIAGSATGVVAAIGQASGSITIGGSATGEVVGDFFEGAASGAISIAGSATGTHGVQGAASGSIAIAGASTGVHGTTGSATGQIAVAGGAMGQLVPVGQASGTIPISGSATGEFEADFFEGTASGFVSIAGSASGVHGVAGSASGAIPVTGSATGEFANRGTASGLVLITGGAQGVHGVSGSAAGLVLIIGGATGEMEFDLLDNPSAVDRGRQRSFRTLGRDHGFYSRGRNRRFVTRAGGV